MAMDEFLEGSALTGRQAAIIFFSFLVLIIIAALVLITFSDFFRNLVSFSGPTDVRTDALALVAGVTFLGRRSQ